MSRKQNSGDGQTKGFGEIDPSFTPPGPVYTNPGGRDLTNPDWVRQDMLYKTQLPQPKYY